MHCRIPESVIHIECLDLVSGEYLDLLHYSLAGPIRKNHWAIFIDPLKNHTTIIIFTNRIHSHQQLALIAAVNPMIINYRDKFTRNIEVLEFAALVQHT